jgi:hypothetical protein
METSITLSAICSPASDVVARQIEDEMVIVPLSSGIGDMENGLFTLNPTGQAIWQKLDGMLALKGVVDLLVSEFDAPPAEIESDVLDFTRELVQRGLLVVTG